MNANEYQEGAARTICPQLVVIERLQRNPRAVQLLHSIVGMMGELGELATAIEKHLWYGQTLDEVNVREEFGDTAWYLAEGVTALDERLGAILETNLAKLRKRYPERYTDHHAAVRDLAAERTALTGAGQNGQGWHEEEDSE